MQVNLHQPAPPVKNRRILQVQSFTALMPLLMATCTFVLPKVLSTNTMSPYLQSRPNIPTISEGASQKSSAVVREIPCLCVCYYYYYYCYYSKSLMKPNTYWVRNIVADALAKHRCHQFAVHIFRIQILILAVEQQSRSI